MYLLYCDETNLDPAKTDFFVYGGIAIPSDSAKILHSAIEEIRKKAKFKETDIFKFNPCPEGVSRDSFNKAKEEMGYAEKFDYVVVNKDVHKAYEEIKSIIISEKCKVERNKNFIEDLIKS